MVFYSRARHKQASQILTLPRSSRLTLNRPTLVVTTLFNSKHLPPNSSLYTSTLQDLHLCTSVPRYLAYRVSVIMGERTPFLFAEGIGHALRQCQQCTAVLSLSSAPVAELASDMSLFVGSGDTLLAVQMRHLPAEHS